MSTYSTTTWKGHQCTIVPRIAVQSRPTNPTNGGPTTTSSPSISSITSRTSPTLQPAAMTGGSASGTSIAGGSSSTTLPDGNNNGGFSSSSSTAVPSVGTSHGSNVAATVGGVVASVGVIILATVAWFLFRRRRRRQQWNSRFFGDLNDSGSVGEVVGRNEKIGFPVAISAESTTTGQRTQRLTPPPGYNLPLDDPNFTSANPFADPPSAPPPPTKSKVGNGLSQFNFFSKGRQNPFADKNAISSLDLPLPSQMDAKRAQSAGTATSGSLYSVNTIIDLPGRPQIRFENKNGNNIPNTENSNLNGATTPNTQRRKLDGVDLARWRRPEDRDRDTVMTTRSDPFDLEMDGTTSSSRMGSWVSDDPYIPDDAEQRRSKFLLAGFEGRISRIGGDSHDVT